MEDNFKHKGRRRILASELRKKALRSRDSAIENIPRHLFIDPGFQNKHILTKLSQ